MVASHADVESYPDKCNVHWFQQTMSGAKLKKVTRNSHMKIHISGLLSA
jgi:hypothetical protein